MKVECCMCLHPKDAGSFLPPSLRLLSPFLPRSLLYLVEEQPLSRALEIFKDADSSPTELRDLLGMGVHHWWMGMTSRAGGVG